MGNTALSVSVHVRREGKSVVESAVIVQAVSEYALCNIHKGFNKTRGGMMGRRKGSKNKPKDINNNGVEVRKVPADSNESADTLNTGISILELTEAVKTREVPTVKYNSNASRTKGVEKRLSSLISKHKSFFLETDVRIEHNNYFVDSGGWAFAQQTDGKYNILISHVRKLLSLY